MIIKEIIRAVREVNQKTPLIGCSTAGEFTEEGLDRKSVSVAMISTDNYKFFTSIASGLKENYESTIKSAAKGLPENVPEFPFKSAIILQDGLAGRGEETVLSAAMFLGNDVQFCGYI